MRNPIIVLETLSEKSGDSSYKFDRLYRNLYNREFYLLAYQNIYAKDGNMTPGSDGTTIDGMSLERIDKIIATMRDHSYQPKPAKRTYIKKKNGKMHPLGIPSSNDKIVQEVVRMILESIYEPTFSKYSHGFRPDKSCHTALSQLHVTFSGVKWFIEGDISACFDSFDHHVLIEILRRRIADEYFIALMWKFLKAGFMEQWTYKHTYSGTPQGSGMSPLLANIYLNELDNFMAQYKENFTKGKHGKRNPEYRQIERRLEKIRKENKENWQKLDKESKLEGLRNQKKIRRLMHNLPTRVPIDPDYRRLQYCRYADDFIISVIGSKEDANAVKADIKQFLTDKLKLTLSDEKTKITHCKDKALFLGYEITTIKNPTVKRNTNGMFRRAGSGAIALYVPYEKWRNKLLDYNAMRIKAIDGEEKWNPVHRGILINLPDIAIIQKYNAEIRGLYNYYRLAHNASVIGKFAFIMEYSMYKTYARKYDSSVSKIINKYSINGVFSIPYDTKDGKKYCIFYNEGFARKEIPLKGEVDVMPRYAKRKEYRGQIKRLKAEICELCHKENVPVVMHHVRKLKDLKGNAEWENVMLMLRRKSLAVCNDCHDLIHKITLESN
jgi:group II intron reverse transcriptase/maturase